jgi:2-dehydropantoate 2-reductase
MRVAVVGAGGVGGYYGAAMARAGHDVRLLARGDHLRAISARGLEVREPEEIWRAGVFAAEDARNLLPADLAIVAVKSYSLPEVAPAVRLLAENGAVVVPLLNGVEAFESLAELGVPPERMLGGLTVISVEKTNPGVITRKSDFRRVIVGEKGGGGSERAERIAAAFRDTGADVRVSEDITVDLWRKFLFLTTLAAACGLARAPVGAVREAPLGPELLDRAGREIAAVARARGVALPEGEENKVLASMNSLAPGLKPSFLLDLERGGPNELDILSGAVSRFGRAYGVPTPIHDTAVAALSAALRSD